MFKKFVILGLALLLAGAAALGWVLTEQRKEKQLRQEQLKILNARLDKLDMLVSGKIDVYPLARIDSGEDLQQELNKYKMRKETRELTFTISVVCMLTGGTIFIWWLLLWMARLLIRGFSHLMKFSAGVFKRSGKITDEQATETNAKEDEEDSEQEQKTHKQQSQLNRRSGALVDSRWRNFNKNYAAWHEPASSQKEPSAENESHLNQSTQPAEKIAVQLCDEESIESKEPLKAETEDTTLNTKPFEQLAQNIRKSTLSDSHENSQKLKDLFKAETDNLEKQMAEFERMTGSAFCDKSQNGQPTETIQQPALEYSEPLSNMLTELTQQVAAIREYACQQQDRVEKLQDGYDWNIVRNFCLRIIRSIDNLENRINRLSEQDIETTDLEEVRDELIFALESSGVEQFKPEINSGYRGQEKNTEVVKDREHCKNPKLAGKIAKVIRPGYQCIIDEENVKIVRAAQVKLFS